MLVKVKASTATNTPFASANFGTVFIAEVGSGCGSASSSSFLQEETSVADNNAMASTFSGFEWLKNIIL
jgi:hypothetical protein